MSEAPPQAEEAMSLAPKLTPQIREWIRALIMVGIALVIMVLLIWSGNMRTRQAEQAAYKRMGDAIAQSMVPHFLGQNWKKTEQDLAKIAEAGNFIEITLTDPNGDLLASSNRSPVNPETLKNAPDSARVGYEPGAVKIERKVWLAEGNSIGAIRILVRR